MKESVAVTIAATTIKTLRSAITLCAPIACALLAGCSKSDNTPPSGVSGVTPDGRMEMQFRWIAGKQYFMRMDLSSTSEAVVPNQRTPIKQATRMAQDYTISVLKELPDGGKELQLEFTGTEMEVKMGESVVMSFDSAEDLRRNDGNPVAPMLRRTVGGRLKYVTDVDGRVALVEGVGEFVAHVMQGSPPMIQAALGNMYNEGYFKQLCDVARMAPSRGVKPGDSWLVNMQEEMGPLGTLVIKSKLKFKDWEQHGARKCARIESKGNLSSKPSSAVAASAAPMAMQIENGKMTATGWFDPELGMVVESVADQTLNLKITTLGNTMKSPTDQRVSFKLLDVVDLDK